MEIEGDLKTDDDEKLSIDKVAKLLDSIGLQTPIDYIFLDFAVQKSRSSMREVVDQPAFLFHTIRSKESLEDEKPFPHSVFIEKFSQKGFINSEDGSIKTSEQYIMWNLVPSTEWEKREILSFGDFHLYFIDVLKPMFGYSAEELYKIFDQKKGDMFFLVQGHHSINDKCIILFITKRNIIVFHVPKFEIVDKVENKFLSKWISMDIPTEIQELHEYAIFELPSQNLVLTTEETNESKGDDKMECPDCVV